jgi:hypothetical protein
VHFAPMLTFTAATIFLFFRFTRAVWQYGRDE